MTAWLIGALVALAGVVGAWLKGRGRGRADAKARQDRADNDAYRRMNDAGNDVDSASDADVDRRLRDHAGKH
ncbi:hypothetical protein [Paracoccus sp. DMF]|uniref:hypothetical protein n=1 Tax=Paracoccus sp. DMF TaxID=400837 RepID=UPI00110468C5|nr:hypothetical protein [Paracoccus sp. DMF]MCV2448905.1 hypothetical protein [Paracoccus sp. DMF]